MKPSNKEIAKTLRDAVPYLWNGVGVKNDERKISTFICNAISYGADDFNVIYRDNDKCTSGYVRKIVSDRIDGAPVAECWLLNMGIEEYENKKKMQAWRHQWLQMMIKEFEDKV